MKSHSQASDRRQPWKEGQRCLRSFFNQPCLTFFHSLAANPMAAGSVLLPLGFLSRVERTSWLAIEILLGMLPFSLQIRFQCLQRKGGDGTQVSFKTDGMMLRAVIIERRECFGFDFATVRRCRTRKTRRFPHFLQHLLSNLQTDQHIRNGCLPNPQNPRYNSFFALVMSIIEIDHQTRPRFQGQQSISSLI